MECWLFVSLLDVYTETALWLVTQHQPEILEVARNPRTAVLMGTLGGDGY